MTQSLDQESWVFGSSSVTPKALRSVLERVDVCNKGRHEDKYSHTEYRFSSRPRCEEQLSIVYHSGYNGSPCLDNAYTPHHCSNILLAREELIEEGYAPAKYVGVYAMTHLGSPHQKGSFGKEPLFTYDDWIQSTVSRFQGLPHYTQKLLCASSQGVDLLVKSAVQYNQTLAPNKFKLAGVFGVSSALNAVDDDFRAGLMSQLSWLEKGLYLGGEEVSVTTGTAKYRFSKEFCDVALKHMLDTKQDIFDDVPVCLLHESNDGVIPLAKLQAQANKIFGEREGLVRSYHCEDDPVAAHAFNSTCLLEQERVEFKGLLKEACLMSGIESNVSALECKLG